LTDEVHRHGNSKEPEHSRARFSRYIGTDYSGARTPDFSLKGLRGYSLPAATCIPIDIFQLLI